MNTNDSPVQKLVREAARQLQISSGEQSLAGKVKKIVEDTVGGWNSHTVPRTSGAFGMESFEVVPDRAPGFDAVRDANPTEMMRSLHKLGMADRHVVQVAESVLNLFDTSPERQPQNLLRGGQQVNGAHASMSLVIGRSSAAGVSALESGFATEAFGDDINRLATDDRLTMDLMIMRPWENIMDKGLARVSDSSPVVTIRIPSPQAYDWFATQAQGSTAQSRSGYANTYLLRDLYRNPSPVNSAPKKIIPVVANDVNNVIFDATSTQGMATPFYKTGKEVSLLDLSRNAAQFGYAQVDRTDLVADGGVLDNVIISITNPNGGNPVTEYFLLPTRPFELAMFVISPANKSADQRQVMMQAILPFSAATKTYTGANSTIAAQFTDAKIQINVVVNASLFIGTGLMQASGTVNMTLKPLASGVAISPGTTTLFGNLTAQLAAYSVDVQFDEENQRKANLAVWVQYSEKQFVVPRGRVYLTEYSLSQDIDENAIAATSSMVTLGNGRRGLTIIVNALNDISTGLSYVAANPEIAAANSIDEQSFAAALVKPTVVTTTLDFGTEELNTMNESTRLSEIHGRFRARFLSMVTILFAKSLMLNQYKAGEVPVIKAWVHSTIADLVIGILDYHPDLHDRNTTATGADYSMILPNGYRLDVIKSNLDCLQGRLYAVPVIESDMASILSAASIRDCGTVTTNYTPTNSGAVVRRVATTSREIVMMSNKVGICMIIQGLSTQLGPIAYTAVPLNLDYSDSVVI